MAKYKVIGKFYEPIDTVVELREVEGDAWVKLGRLEVVETAVSKPKRKPRRRKAKSGE